MQPGQPSCQGRAGRADHCIGAGQVEDGSLGSPPARDLMGALRPRYWFSAHMHTKFAAMVSHEGGGATRFLALDKCLPGRHFLQVSCPVPSSP